MEQLYTPITPCRAFDVNIAANAVRTLLVSGTDFTAQKGPAAGCGVPASATAVSVKLAVIRPSVAGYLNPYATGTTKPNIGGNYYPAGETLSMDAIAQVGAGSTSLYSVKAARVIGDITGYYAPQIQVYMNPNGTAYSATTRILSTAKLGTGSYKIETDRNLQLCSVRANIAGGFYYTSAYPSGNSVYVSTWAITSGTATPTDLYHNVSVKC